MYHSLLLCFSPSNYDLFVSNICLSLHGPSSVDCSNYFGLRRFNDKISDETTYDEITYEKSFRQNRGHKVMIKSESYKSQPTVFTQFVAQYLQSMSRREEVICKLLRYFLFSHHRPRVSFPVAIIFKPFQSHHHEVILIKCISLTILTWDATVFVVEDSILSFNGLFVWQWLWRPH